MSRKPKRRAKGSYHERAPGVWTVRVSPPRGERRSYTVRGTKRKAERFLEEKVKQQEEHRLPAKDAGEISFGDFAHQAIARNPKASPATRERMRALFDRYTSPRLVNLSLADVSPATLAEERDRLLSQPSQRGKGQTLSPKSVTLVMAGWASVFRIAVKEQRLAETANPMRGIDWPEAEDSKQQGRALTPEETERVLAVDEWPALWQLMLRLGPRPSEALGLKWADVDFKKSELRIERALVRVKDQWQFASTKTRKARTVPLPLPVRVALERHRHRQQQERDDAGEGYQDQDLVFADPAGRIVPPWSFKKIWKRVLKAGKVTTPYRLYDTRHTAATRLVEHGLDFINVAKILGNSAKQVAERYGHARLDLQREALDAVTTRPTKVAPAHAG